MPFRAPRSPVAKKLLGGGEATVVDVGAATGMHPRFDALRPNLRAVLFEPDKRSYDELSAGNDGATIFNCALDQSNGTRTINLTRKGQCSSFLRPRRELIDDFPEPERYDIERQVDVETRTLDTVSESTSEIDFVKLDAQGAELGILQGGTAILEDVWGLEIEVEFTAIYEGQPLFSDLDPFVRAKGFELFDLERYYWARSSCADMGRTSGHLIFADALYFKRADEVERILAARPSMATRVDKFRRLIALLYVYRRNDYALHLLNRFTSSGLVAMEASELHDLRACVMNNHDPVLPRFKGRDRLGPAMVERLAALFSSRTYWRVDSDF